MRLKGEQPVSLSEQKSSNGGSLSHPTAHQMCSSEPMVGAIILWKREPSPLRGGEEVRTRECAEESTF